MPFLTADESDPPSFARGFEMLNALGPSAPDQNASWSKIESQHILQSNALRELSSSMQGNAWRLTSTQDSSPMAIHFGNAVPQNIEFEETPPNGDLKKDTARIIDAISKIERIHDLEEFRRPWSDGGSRTFGPLMIFAAQLHQTGNPQLANQLAWALFQAAPSREAVIDAALDHLGNELYHQVAERFFENHNWQAFHDELATLIEKLPRGWDAQPAALLTLEALTLRVENPTPPKPELDGIPITQDAKAAIAWMTKPPETSVHPPAIPPELVAMLEHIPPEHHARFLEHHGQGGSTNSLKNPGFWLLNNTSDITTTNTGPIDQTLALGLEAIPVLAALATDPYPTHFHNPHGNRNNFSYSRGAATRAMEMHASMVRPATRGDIARMILSPILPDARGHLRRADHQVFQDIAIEFYQSHKGKDSGEIAAVYLAEGDDNQKNQAATFLATSSIPRHHVIFENHVLNSAPATANLQAVITFAQQRKTDAKPLLEKYLPLIREEVGDGSNVEQDRTLHWQFRQPGQLNQTLRQLEAIAEGKSSFDTAIEIATGPPEEATPAIRALLQNISSENTLNQLEILLAGATAADDTQIRHTFLNHVFSIRFQPAGNVDNRDEGSPPTIPEKIREAWNILATDDRNIESEWVTNSYFSADTIAEFAAIAIESRLNEDGIFQIYEATGILKQTLADLCMANVKARMEEEPLPPMPNPENVTEERLREIIASASTKTSTEIHPYLDTLTPDERAAWLVWLMEPGEIEIPQSVRELALTITEEDTNHQEGFVPSPGLLNLKIGFKIHEDTIDTYITDLAKNFATHSLTMANLRNTDFAPGLVSWTLRADIPEKNDEEEEDRNLFSHSHFTPLDLFSEFIAFYMSEHTPENVDALIICQVHSDNDHNTFYWWVVDGKPTPFSVSNRGEFSNEVTTTLAQAISAAREAGRIEMMTIQVLSREDAEKIANL